jgi:FtsP/CotA-like multicopper oxidase with cupredoxin domain
MSDSIRKPMLGGLALILALVLVVMSLSTGFTAPADHGNVPSSGIVCTSNPSATFTLTAKEGYASMTDGNVIYMWSYAEGLDDFQFPGPSLCVNEGDTVTIVLHNSLTQDTSLVFPGQGDVLANGAPNQPQFDGATLTSLANVAPANGGSVTYQFTATKPGTFLYQSGTNPGIQVQMGLYGAIVVRPALGSNYAYDDLQSEFNPETEYLMLLSEIDPILHKAIERGETFDMSLYHPRYFLINGRTFPDTIAPNHASWLPNQPYGSLAHIHPLDPVSNPLPALARYVGVGSDDFPFHPHAFNSRIVGRDGNALISGDGRDLSYERFSITVGPAQTWDALFAWEDDLQLDPNNPDAQVPVDLPGEQNANYGIFFGSAYLGNQDQLPVGTTSYNECGEFYHIAHNHALQQLVGWGVVMTGQTTFTRIDPPLPNNCPVD